MEASNYGNESVDCIYEDSAKAAKIYALILDNFKLDKIEPSQIEIKELTNIDSEKSLNYIKEIANKNDETGGEINDFTNAVKNVLSVLISDIQKDLDTINNLSKLSAYYYLYKIQTANDIYEENDYLEKIDNVVNKILFNKDLYYKILIYLEQFKDSMFGGNKDEKIQGYFKILFYLNENMFIQLLSSFMDNKKKVFSQYKIPLPVISFKEKDLDKKLKQLYNLLYILKKTESFKTNERFEYFYEFRKKHEFLEEINYILYYLKKGILVSLDKSTDDITEEAIKYSLDTKTQKEYCDGFISELIQTVKNGKKKQDEFKEANRSLQEKYNEILRQYKECNDKYNQMFRQYNDQFNKLDNKYTEELDQLEETIISLRTKQVKSNEITNKQNEEIKSLNNKLIKGRSN